MQQNGPKISAKRQIRRNIGTKDESDIPLLHRRQKAGRRMQFAPSASLYYADFTARAGPGGDSTQPSPSQRYNTLDFAGQSRVPRNPCAVSLDSSGCAVQGLGKALPNKYDRSVRRNYKF